MRVGIDIDAQWGFQASGVHMYLDGLLGGLASRQDGHDYLAVAPTLTPLGLRGLHGPWARSGRMPVVTGLHPVPAGPRAPGAGNGLARMVADQVGVRTMRLRPAPFMRRATRGLDILHVANAECPAYDRSAARATVASLHDLSFVTIPWAHSDRNRRVWERYLDWAVRRCDRIVVISEATRRELIDVTGIAADRVDVTPLAARPGTGRVDSPDLRRAVLDGLGIRGRFVLQAGTLEPRKNVERLIAAFATATREPGLDDVELALAGGAWPGMRDRMAAAAERWGVTDRTHFLGYVASEDMNALMSACDVFAYMSIYEGFGLPPLEAMHCAAPVVASNTTSVPEVVGDAGLTVDPLDIEAIAEALARVLSDTALAGRLREKATAQAAGFSWERCAAATVAGYERACA